MSRPSVPAMDAQLGVEHKVLDHGFVRLIDYMGDEAAIVQAARVSYGAGTKTPSDDRSLIRYLIRHRHSSPLEMCEIKLHVKLPIFTARQWIRHRTANVNEISARYSILDREFYVPALADIAEQSKNNKQGRGLAMPYHEASHLQEAFIKQGEGAYKVYHYLLNEDLDDLGKPLDDERPMLARELARCNLTLGHYTQWYWKIDLHNLLHFLSLRLDPHAQLEIRRYADVIWGMVRGWVPTVAEAFEDYRLRAVTFSRQEQVVLQRMLSEMLDPEIAAVASEAKMSKREIEEFKSKIEKIQEA